MTAKALLLGAWLAAVAAPAAAEPDFTGSWERYPQPGSVGRWEGDTLVIETTGVKEYVQFHWAPHSEDMKITERLRLLAPDILRNEIVIEDPHLAEPWTYSYTYRRMPGYKLLEYICEDNRDYVDEQGMHRLRIDE